jgi:O-succinylbenzoate synthase
VTSIRRVELRRIGLPLVRPFRTSMGVATRKECILVRVETGDAEGWGECVADLEPDFSAEWNGSAWEAMTAFLAPALLAAGELSASSLERTFAPWRGNRMAKATLIDAAVDAELRAEGISLASWMGADKAAVICGVSVGIADTTDALREQVDGYLADGYRRIKLKIEPGLDVERVAAIRKDHPDILLSVDANAAYSLAHLDVFRALDDFDLLMIEQPLSHEDLVDHAKLQAQIRTDLCLDESIRSAADAPRSSSARAAS